MLIAILPPHSKSILLLLSYVIATEPLADALAADGVYLLGLHLTPTEGQAMEEERWRAARGKLEIRSLLRTVEVDRYRRRERLALTFDVKTAHREFRLEEEMVFRTYTAAQLKELIDATPA